MIVFIDDEVRYLAAAADDLRELGHEVVLCAGIESGIAVLRERSQEVRLVVLDIMFPGTRAVGAGLSRSGLTAGTAALAAIRAEWAELPVLVYTGIQVPEVLEYLASQPGCHLLRKSTSLEPLVACAATLANRPGPELARRLTELSSGRATALEFQHLGAAILRFLFVPPLRSVRTEVTSTRTGKRRDALLVNDAESGPWSVLRRDLGARYVVVEFKNSARPVGPRAVDQLRVYLLQKHLGRLGLLIARRGLSAGGSRACLAAFHEEPRAVIVGIDDDFLRRLIAERSAARDPAALLLEAIQRFEMQA